MNSVEDARSSPIPNGPTARVLVVDDDSQVRESFARMLNADGCWVVQATSGDDARKLLAKSQFDVVMSDVQMPDMNGIELLQLVRAEDPDLSVVLISGAPDLETALKAVELGATEYLTKPIEPERLITSIQRAVTVARTKREERATLESFHFRTRNPSSVPSSGSWTGTVLSGRYRIGEKIGVGGMGAVYEATRVDFADMVVAIKIVHEALSSDKTIMARFQREAEAIARLNHQNIVHVFDFEVPPRGPAILVMERLRGQALASLIASESPLEARRVVFIATQTLFALSAAHEMGIIHRDLKPENIFLISMSGVDDVVRVLDFGIAKFAETEAASRLTLTGAVLGTPVYMAPEQTRGAPADARSDIYSLGCVMYEALAGKPPFLAENYHALLVCIQEANPQPLASLRPDIDPALIDVINTALAKEASERFPTAQAMIDALEPWLPTLAPKARESQPSPRVGFSELELRHHLKTTRKEGKSEG